MRTNEEYDNLAQRFNVKVSVLVESDDLYRAAVATIRLDSLAMERGMQTVWRLHLDLVPTNENLWQISEAGSGRAPATITARDWPSAVDALAERANWLAELLRRTEAERAEGLGTSMVEADRNRSRFRVIGPN